MARDDDMASADLEQVEKHSMRKLVELIDGNRFDEAGKLVALLQAVSIV